MHSTKWKFLKWILVSAGNNAFECVFVLDHSLFPTKGSRMWTLSMKINQADVPRCRLHDPPTI